MPAQRCTSKGKAGYRWGTKGKCYTGNGKAKAARQGKAIKASQTRRNK